VLLQSYEGAIGQGPGLEAHGGSTYCAIAALVLMDRLDVFSPDQLDKLQRWLLLRQINGFQGRPNKPDDTCYSFWVGASLRVRLFRKQFHLKLIFGLKILKYCCIYKWKIDKPAIFLQLLGASQFIDEKRNRDYILSTQHDYTGGFSKWSDTQPDPLHTYFGE
jgi:geranylgeranyl transferase type-1 subunit beta